MKNVRSFLGPAFVASISLHAAVIALGMLLVAPASIIPALAPEDLKVRLHERLVEPEVSTIAPAPARPQLRLPLDTPRKSRAVSVGAAPARLAGAAALKAAEQLARDLPYPPEAIERGLQGEALVLIFLDETGNAIAARIETSSGHALLDDAALRAARTLRALPDSAPREALLPVRFRLR
jgi:periplasmic protein TonB